MSMTVKTIIMLVILIVGIVFLSALFVRDKRKMKKRSGTMTKNKNLRTIKITVNSQTLYHMQMLAAMAGWGEKDLGRVVDKLMKAYCLQREGGGANVKPETKAFTADKRNFRDGTE